MNDYPRALIIDEPFHGFLNEIIHCIDQYWDRPLLSHYTNHGIDHSERIINALGMLLEDYPNILNETEKFILLSAVYLHDIGMQSPEFAGLPRKETYSFEELDKIREHHHVATENMIKDSLKKKSELNLGLQNSKDYAGYIATISKYHRKLDIKNLDDSNIEGNKIRLPLLASLIRIGDELDLDHRRINMKVLKLREIPVESKFFWWGHHYVKSVPVTNGKIQLYFRFPESYRENDNDLILAIKNKILESIKAQYFEVYDILDKYNIRLYREPVIKEETFESEGVLELIPDDLKTYIQDKIINIEKRSKEIERKTGCSWYIDGIAYSDDEKVFELMDELIKLINMSKNKEALDIIKNSRTLFMSPKEKMIFLNLSGVCHLILGNIMDSEICFQEIIEISNRKDLIEIYKEEVKRIQSNALGNIGLIYHAKGDSDQAMKYHQDALEIDREIGYKQGEANQLGNIGLIYSDKGDPDKALKYLEDSQKIHREIGDKLGEASGLGNIGVIYRDKGDLNQALKYLKDAQKFHCKIGDKLGEASDLGNIGVIYRDKGDLNQALKYLKDALKIHRVIGYKQGEANHFGNIGVIYHTKGDLNQALKYYQDARKIHREIDYKQGEASDLGNIGLIYRDKRDLNRALKYLEDALEIDRDIGYKQGEASQLGNIGMIYRDKGDNKNSLQYLKDALNILNEYNLVHGRDIIIKAIDEIETG